MKGCESERIKSPKLSASRRTPNLRLNLTVYCLPVLSEAFTVGAFMNTCLVYCTVRVALALDRKTVDDHNAAKGRAQSHRFCCFQYR
jgi:hypothetical protein